HLADQRDDLGAIRCCGQADIEHVLSTVTCRSCSCGGAPSDELPTLAADAKARRAGATHLDRNPNADTRGGPGLAASPRLRVGGGRWCRTGRGEAAALRRDAVARIPPRTPSGVRLPSRRWQQHPGIRTRVSLGTPWACPHCSSPRCGSACRTTER